MDDARRGLIATLRHRLHNPLQAVLAEAELLDADDASAEQIRLGARAIRDAARRIAEEVARLDREVAETPASEAGVTPGASALTRALADELQGLARRLESGATGDPTPHLRKAARLANLWADRATAGPPSEAGPDPAVVALIDRIRRLQAENQRLRAATSTPEARA